MYKRILITIAFPAAVAIAPLSCSLRPGSPLRRRDSHPPRHLGSMKQACGQP